MRYISARVEVLLFEIARCLWIRSSFCSNFEKQNRKGSPQSLIYPLKGKLTSFAIKQFFSFKKVHQTLMRSRLRRFCSERRTQVTAMVSKRLCRFVQRHINSPLFDLSWPRCAFLLRKTSTCTEICSRTDPWRFNSVRAQDDEKTGARHSLLKGTSPRCHPERAEFFTKNM